MNSQEHKHFEIKNGGGNNLITVG